MKAIRRARHEAFTLVEILVSMVVLLLIMVGLLLVTNSTQKLLSRSTLRIEQFKHAREAFEVITRRLSQATLNTYWDYRRDPSTGMPTAYVRQSELRFISGPATKLGLGAGRTTHGLFFQAPLGVSAGSTSPGNSSSYAQLDSLLNTTGYCLEFGDDRQYRPAFVNSPLRWRFRLMEIVEPSQSFDLYSDEIAAGGNAAYTLTTWFTGPLGAVGAASRPVRVAAENILALVLLPKLSSQADPTGNKLCPTYYYDSMRTDDANDSKVDPTINWKNQLPPEVQLTMVAVDEGSYARFQSTSTSLPTRLGLDKLFTTSGDLQNSANPGYAQDLQTLRSTLQSYHLDYRVFTASVSLKQAKWSTTQSN